MKAIELKGLTPDKIITKIGPLFTADQKKSGILASVSMGQFILESGWGKSELAQKANNCFGMKKTLSGNTWAGSTWNKKSVYEKVTAEYKNGTDKYYIKAAFRKYPSIELSIADHSAYLNGAMNGSVKRYAGLKGCKDYKQALDIIRAGGYATSAQYGRDVIKIIEQYNLTRFDVKEEAKKEEKKGTKKMRINVHAGHTKQSGNAPGASGIVHESVEDRKIANELIKILKKRGHKVYKCTSNGKNSRDNLQRIVTKCNKHKVDLDVSIHLNCYNKSAHGTETLIYSDSSKAKPYARRIDANLAALGFTDRGVKVRSDLYVLHWTNAPALLIETFFCDNRDDCNLYKKLGYKKIAKAIADGIAPKK